MKRTRRCRVLRYLRRERRERLEALFIAELVQEINVQKPPVEVAAEIQQVHLQLSAHATHRRHAADVRHTDQRLVLEPEHLHRVHTAERRALAMQMDAVSNT